MFNDCNVDNRLRHLVRGRVIVFTTSRVVEFLEESLKRSFPLYSVDSMPTGFGLVFMVEVNGYLTFDANSYVKISDEFSPFSTFYFDPNACKFVQPADQFVPTVTTLNVVKLDGVNASYFEVYYTDPNPAFSPSMQFRSASGAVIYADSAEYIRFTKALAVGKPFLGVNGYPGLVQTYSE